MHPRPESQLDHLQCTRCATKHDADVPQGLCACGGPLYARYRLDAAAASMRPGALAERTPDLWRYREVLPVRNEAFQLSLGEGFTPLVRSRVLGPRLGIDLWMKDESGNPTGSFKARGLSVAVARARELRAATVVLPTAGNAGGALAAYAALHGLAARVYLPEGASDVFAHEATLHGATVVRVPGTIADAAQRMKAERQDGWYDVSTLKEPYRLEGKKTMGYELLDQLGSLPDVIVYPTGGGTGLLGMWKAFGELAAMGRDAARPAMVAVQAAGCQPVVRAFLEGAPAMEPWPDPSTIAEGLRVPRPHADREILSVLRESGGTAVAVPDAEIRRAVADLARSEGILTSPEGAATVAALPQLRDSGAVRPGARVVLFLTGSAFKYPAALADAARAARETP